MTLVCGYKFTMDTDTKIKHDNSLKFRMDETALRSYVGLNNEKSTCAPKRQWNFSFSLIAPYDN